MIRDKLKTFFKENANFTVFSQGKDSPLFKFIQNSESLNNLKTLNKILTQKDNMKMIFMGVALTVCFNNFFQYAADQLENKITVASMAVQKTFSNNVPHVAFINGLDTTFEIAHCPVTIKKDIKTNNTLNVVLYNDTDLEDPYCVDNEEDVERLQNVDFNFKKPAAQFAHYYNDKYKRKIPSQQEMNEIGNYYGVPENVLYFMAFKESKFDLDAKSAKNAKGLIGFMDDTAKEFGLIKVNSKGKIYQNHSKNGYANIDTAARYLMWLNYYINGEDADLNDKSKDKKGFTNLDYALAAYNAGIGTVYNFEKNTKKIPMYRETRSYIRDIVALANGDAVVAKKGQDFEILSATYNISPYALDRFNPHLSKDKYIPNGTVVIIPTEQQISQPIQAIVRKGWTIKKIAERYAVEVEELLKANEDNKYLQNGQLRAGDLIYIPTNDLPEYKNIEQSKKSKLSTTS